MPGTTGSTGLNNLLESSNQVQTTMPAWYDAAQQNIINQAGTAMGAAPQFQNTVGQQAVNLMQNPNNPFAQASSTLGQISSGAANPWITDASGNVTPNTQTAMGGLFSAQQNQLNQLLPTVTAPQQAAGIGTGQFGSLRGQTAVDTAKANALATLQAQQMEAALQNQQIGSAAAANLANVGTQNLAGALTTGQAQQNAPYQSLGNYANLVNALTVPGTVTQQNQQSPLQAVSVLAGLPSTGANLLNQVFGSSDTSGSILNLLSSLPGVGGLFSGSSSQG
jgi:hypothetical protein